MDLALVMMLTIEHDEHDGAVVAVRDAAGALAAGFAPHGAHNFLKTKVSVCVFLDSHFS